MIRFGVIGTNWITDRWVQAGLQLETFELTAVYSRNEETGKEFAHKYGVERVYTNLEEMATSDEIDAVYIASPNSLHASQAILFLSNGKHVMCEKPLASNVREIKAMIQCAKENNVLLMEAMKTTCLPMMKTLEKAMSRIGTIHRIHFNFCQYSSRYDAFKQGLLPNTFNPQFSNGSLMDLGVYGVAPIVHLFGRPNEVMASAVKLPTGVDGSGTVILKYNQFDAIITHSKTTSSVLSSEVQGEKGSLLIEHLSRLSNIKIKFRDGGEQHFANDEEENDMIYEIQEFIETLQQGNLESAINTYERSMMTMEILDEARKQTGVSYPADAVL